MALRFAARLNTLTALAVTKLDVLSGFDRLKVCVRYRGAEGAEFDHFPYHQTVLHHAGGEYIELPGWSENLRECREESDLPGPAREYLQFVQSCVGVPLALVGVGPGADDVIWMSGTTASTDGPLPATGPVGVQASRR